MSLKLHHALYRSHARLLTILIKHSFSCQLQILFDGSDQFLIFIYSQVSNKQAGLAKLFIHYLKKNKKLLKKEKGILVYQKPKSSNLSDMVNLLKLQNFNHFYLASYTAAAVIAQKKIENRRLLKGPSTGGQQSSSFSFQRNFTQAMSLLYASLKMAKGYERTAISTRNHPYITSAKRLGRCTASQHRFE